jgi:hypothetical protein
MAAMLPRPLSPLATTLSQSPSPPPASPVAAAAHVTPVAVPQSGEGGDPKTPTSDTIRAARAKYFSSPPATTSLSSPSVTVSASLPAKKEECANASETEVGEEERSG